PSRRAALTMSSSSAPATTTLWASWATVEAMAPRRTPRPWMNPSPTRPVPRWRSDDCDLGEVTLGVGDRRPLGDPRRHSQRVGDDLAGAHADHARVAALPGDAQITARERGDVH